MHLHPVSTPLSAAGAGAQSPEPGAQTGGARLDALPGGGDLYVDREAALLLSHAQAHSHLLLHHAAKSREDHLSDLKLSAGFWTFVWMWPIGLLLAEASKLLVMLVVIATGEVSAGSCTAISLSLGLAAVLLPYLLFTGIVRSKDRLSATWGWERKRWLDTARRKFVFQFQTFGREHTFKQVVTSMDDLALFGQTNSEGENSLYELHLVDRRQVPPNGTARASTRRVCALHRSHDSMQDVCVLGEQLAALWQVPFVRDF